jgi:hypothetical protein
MGAYSGARTASLVGAHEFIRHLVGFVLLNSLFTM